ncbi:unnamed protein product [Caenorhabditis angaria]|uniref:Uncharacterized protein n=1 Tax=Caenorhabditis angaria TaxID=860376 RepID=A0A9P1IQN5_9PELO|nr:unnamed protein product [Caenorhabditis angaria]
MSFFEKLYSTHSANISAIGGPGIFGKIGTPNWFYVSHSQPIDLKVEISSKNVKVGGTLNGLSNKVQAAKSEISVTTVGTLNGLLDKVQKAKSEISVTTGPNMRSEPSFSQLSDRTWANYDREVTFSKQCNNGMRIETKEIRIAWFFGGEKNNRK